MYIIGAGAQTKYVMDIIREQSKYVKIFDPIGGKINTQINNISVEKFNLDEMPDGVEVVLCLPNNKFKSKIYEKIENKEFSFPTMIHKKATISKTALVHKGSIFNAGCVIQPDSKIGMFSMIHANVIVEHDCMVGEFCNLAPASVLCGHVQVGAYTTIGPSSIIGKIVKIGTNCIIGAGSVVLKDIPDNVIAWGNPCKIIRDNEV